MVGTKQRGCYLPPLGRGAVFEIVAGGLDACGYEAFEELKGMCRHHALPVEQYAGKKECGGGWATNECVRYVRSDGIEMSPIPKMVGCLSQIRWKYSYFTRMG